MSSQLDPRTLSPQRPVHHGQVGFPGAALTYKRRGDNDVVVMWGEHWQGMSMPSFYSVHCGLKLWNQQLPASSIFCTAYCIQSLWQDDLFWRCRLRLWQVSRCKTYIHIHLLAGCYKIHIHLNICMRASKNSSKDKLLWGSRVQPFYWPTILQTVFLFCRLAVYIFGLMGGVEIRSAYDRCANCDVLLLNYHAWPDCPAKELWGKNVPLGHCYTPFILSVCKVYSITMLEI